jgi:hypothetical protein
MDITLADLEALFVNETYTRKEILKVFRAYERTQKLAKGSPDEVAEDWKIVMEEPRALFDASRIRLIKRALEHYTVDELRLVNRGCCLSPYHMGTDPNNREGKIWNYPELLYKDAQHIEMFLGIAKLHKITPDANIRKSDYDGTKSTEDVVFSDFVPSERI